MTKLDLTGIETTPITEALIESLQGEVHSYLKAAQAYAGIMEEGVLLLQKGVAGSDDLSAEEQLSALQGGAAYFLKGMGLALASTIVKAIVDGAEKDKERRSLLTEPAEQATLTPDTP